MHFPLALLIAALAAAVVWTISGTTFWRRCTLFQLFLAMGGTVLAYVTGEAMEEQSQGVPIVDELVDLHEQMALYTLVATALTLLGMAALTFYLERRTTIERDPRDPLAARIVFGLATLVSAVLVAWTAHIGGTMVWGVTR